MWKNIEINLQNIEFETEKATLIKMPNKSEYAGYKFWHPSKLIRYGSHSYARSLSYTNDFTFKLFKNGKGKHNKFDIVDKIEIGADEFEEAFDIMSENIRDKNEETYLIVNEPEKITKKVEIAECLKNN